MDFFFKTKVKLPVTWQKYHYEIGFIQQETGILGQAIPSNIFKNGIFIWE